jgi:ubiquinone/menaquinone biosynthesis C-methylase UbiE
MTHAQSSSEIFQASAEVYTKMVDQNYLFHREVYACLHGLLMDRKPFRFLDVACWDAACSAQALANTSIAEYYGIDIVPEALALASENLRGKLHCPIYLQQGDFIPTLAQWDRPVDVVWIGLSLHHLESSGKLALMGTIRRFLPEDGELLIYENTSPDGEDRDSWLARWDLQRTAWTAYSDEEFRRMNEHVHTHDYPETCSAWREMGHAAGFAEVGEIYSCPTDLFRMYRFANT